MGMRNTQKGFLVPLVLLVVAVAGIAAGAYFNQPSTSEDLPSARHIAPTIHEDNNQFVPLAAPASLEPSVVEEVEVQPVAASVASGKLSVDTAASKKYTNTSLGFSVKYPARLVVEEGVAPSDTRFVVWKDPRSDNAKVAIVYITGAPLALSAAERAQGTPATIGSDEGYVFEKDGAPFYWIERPDYSLAIQLLLKENSIDLDSFQF